MTSLSNDMTKNNAELKKLVDANAKAIEANKKAIEESAKKITQLESDLAAAKTEIKNGEDSVSVAGDALHLKRCERSATTGSCPIRPRPATNLTSIVILSLIMTRKK